MKKLLALILSLAVILTLCTAASAETAVFVSPDGLDSNDGSISTPFATLQKAADEVSEGGIIYLREGTYSQGAILKHGVTIKPYNKEKVVFSAAQKVTPEPITKEEKELLATSEAKKNAVSLKGIENVGEITADGISPVLLNNGKYELPASFSEDTVSEFYVYLSSGNITEFLNYTDKIPLDDGLADYTFIVNSSASDIDFGSLIASESFYVSGKIASYEFLCPFRYDKKTQLLTITAKDLDTPKTSHAVGGNLLFIHSADFINKHGEWAISGDKVFYYPRSTSTNLEYIADRTTFISAENTNGIKISGIEFSKTLGCGIDLKECENVEITGCSFTNISDSAIVLDTCDGTKISNCDFNENGGQAIRTESNKCVIDNCGFENNSVLHISSNSPIYIEGNENTVSNCEISFSPVAAISIKGNKNTVAHCDISRSATVSGTGAVIINPDSSGNTLYGNYFHNLERNFTEKEVTTHFYGFGVYTESEVTNQDDIDEDIRRGISTSPLGGISLITGSDNTTVTGNSFYYTDIGVDIIGSHNNTIKNNVFGTKLVYTDLGNGYDFDTAENFPPKNNILSDNIICDQDDIFGTNYTDNNNIMENNTRFSRSVIYNRDGTLKQEEIHKKLPDFEVPDIEGMGRYEVQETESVFDSGIVLVIGSDNVSARGVISKIDTSARIVEGRTLVPVRYISESFGEEVGWDDETKTVTVGDSVSITLGKPSITVNGTEQTIDVPAAIYDSRTFVPLRAIAEALGKSVFWDDRGLIVITDTRTEITTEEATELIEKLK